MTMILCNSKRCTACLPVGLPTVNVDERLTIRNFILLKRFVSGISIQQIVNIDNIDIKKLYVHKLRLENKLGHSIHKIISEYFIDPFPFLLFPYYCDVEDALRHNAGGRMPTPQNYSFIAIAVSAALASMVFPSQAAWVDVDSLPSSGLVSQLPPELQAIIPAQASTGFTKVGTMPNYVYQWNTGTIPVYGNGLTLNGPGAEAFEHTVTVIQNSGTGSPGVIFGNDLTIRTQSANAANNGRDVDGIRT